MTLLPADYVLCGLTLVAAVSGLFRGFSGTLAFVLATLAASVAGTFGWAQSPSFTDVLWMRVIGTLVATLLVFGLVRVIVRRIVNGLLAQPADAIFGFLVGILIGALATLAWAYSGFHTECSALVTQVAGWIR